MPIDVVERPRLEHGLKVKRLVGDEIAERHPDSWQRRLVERNERVAQGHDKQQLRKLKHRVTKALTREHHLDAMPRQDDRRQGQKQPMAEAKELRLVRQQKTRDRLLNRWEQIEFHESLRNRLRLPPRYDLHRQSSSVGISGSFAVDDELFDHPDEQLDASLTLASADHGGTTDLVEDRRRALIA